MISDLFLSILELKAEKADGVGVKGPWDIFVKQLIFWCECGGTTLYACNSVINSIVKYGASIKI